MPIGPRRAAGANSEALTCPKFLHFLLAEGNQIPVAICLDFRDKRK